MLLHPTCEPIDLPVETLALVEFVRKSAEAPLPKPFLHFHDVAEIVLFGEAHGSLLCEGKNFAIEPGSVAIVPSMRYHDFAFESGAKNWVLIQLDPYLIERIAARTGSVLHTNCAKPTQADAARLTMLAEWLNDVLGQNSDAVVVEEIAALIVTILARLPHADARGSNEIATDMERFMPVIEHLRQQPGSALPLGVAATMCNLSPAYFSRRFALIFGCGFADYAASYRLHLAARHVATTATPISTISYDLGFASPSHFAERYRERFGMSPREYRKRMRNGRIA